MPGGPRIEDVVVGDGVDAGVTGELQHPHRDHGQVAAGRTENLGEFLKMDVEGVGDDFPPQ